MADKAKQNPESQEEPIESLVDENAKYMKKEGKKEIKQKFTTQLPKATDLKDATVDLYLDDIDSTTEAAEKEISDLEDKYQEGIEDVGAHYTVERDAIVDNHEAAVERLYQLYLNNLSVFADNEGESEKIDTYEEAYDFAMYGFPQLKGIDLRNFYHQIEWDEGLRNADRAAFEILDQLANGHELEEEHYVYLAERLIEVAGSGLQEMELVEDEPKMAVIEASNYCVIGLTQALDQAQRMHLAELLVDQGTENKGVDVVHRLTCTGFLDPTQAQILYNRAQDQGKITDDKYAEYIGHVEEGTYTEVQEKIAEYTRTAVEDMTKYPHRDFANHILSYKNLAVWEGGRYVAIGMVVLNAAMCIAQGDPMSILYNPAVWAGTAATIVSYDIVTEGGSREILRKLDDDREEDELTRNVSAFRDHLFRNGDLAQWFCENWENVYEGLEHVTQGGKEELRGKIPSFGVMGVETPERFGEVQDPVDMQIMVGELATELYFDLQGNSKFSFRQDLEDAVIARGLSDTIEIPPITP